MNAGETVSNTMPAETPRRKTSTLNMIRRLSERLVRGEVGGTRQPAPDTGVPVAHTSTPPMPADEFETAVRGQRRARRLF